MDVVWAILLTLVLISFQSSTNGAEFDLTSYGAKVEFDARSYGALGEFDVKSYEETGEFDVTSYGENEDGEKEDGEKEDGEKGDGKKKGGEKGDGKKKDDEKGDGKKKGGEKGDGKKKGGEKGDSGKEGSEKGGGEKGDGGKGGGEKGDGEKGDGKKKDGEKGDGKKKGGEKGDSGKEGSKKGSGEKGGREKGGGERGDGGKGGGEKGSGEKGGGEKGGGERGDGGKGGGEKGGGGKGGGEGGAKEEFDVMRYGAKGDGSMNDAPAFLKAWENVCSSKGKSPVLLIPSGKNFVLSSVKFSGPCAAPSVSVLVLGNVISSTNKEHWSTCQDWISFNDITNLVVKGSGSFDGSGNKWWKDELSCGKRPTNLAFNGCKDISVSGIHSKDSARNHFSISNVNGALISGIKLTAPEDSPNTDGMDISTSTAITVKDSIIGTGDDCIAINNHCNNINIANILCGPGHGISVGSLGENGEVARVEDVLVHNCTFIGTTNGARIKTWKGGKGYARRITYQNIKLVNVRRPIIIDQNYVNKQHKPSLDYEDSQSVTISDVKFLNFKGTCVDTDAITLACSTSGSGCTNIDIENIHITSKTGNSLQTLCNNVDGKAIQTNPKVNCLRNERSRLKRPIYY